MIIKSGYSNPNKQNIPKKPVMFFQNITGFFETESTKGLSLTVLHKLRPIIYHTYLFHHPKK